MLPATVAERYRARRRSLARGDPRGRLHQRALSAIDAHRAPDSL